MPWRGRDCRREEADSSAWRRPPLVGRQAGPSKRVSGTRSQGQAAGAGRRSAVVVEARQRVVAGRLGQAAARGAVDRGHVVALLHPMEGTEPFHAASPAWFQGPIFKHT